MRQREKERERVFPISLWYMISFGAYITYINKNVESNNM